MKAFTPTCTFVTISILISALTYAQAATLDSEEIFNEHFKDWYQIEIIIFERIEQSSQDQELWPLDLSIDYSPPFAFLIDPDKELEEDENDNPSKTEEVPTSTQEENPGENNSELLQTLKRSDSDDPLNKKYRDAIAKAELDRLTPKEQPLVLLDEEIQSLQEEARIIGRNPYMRLLAHRVWRQALTSGNDAPSIIITGGDAFGEHYELEGSIKLHLSRYLHIQTNLWLTQFEASIGQESEYWPNLPLRPQPPIEVDLNEPSEEPLENIGAANNTEAEVIVATTTSANEEGKNNSIPERSENTAMLHSDLEPTGIDQTELQGLLSGTDQDFGLGYQSKSTFSFGDSSNALDAGFESENVSPYVITQIVALKQKRRMRSGELHYIDHPKLGMLITLSKYEPEFEAEKDEN
ncbi:MAG: peptidoglycan binding protein CsiV [Agarilytica sp.]